MPNYKSKMLTFLSIGEMTGLLLDNTDEDGILFAVATDSTNFKIVMWRKTSTATVDNETVYPANGPGRWHVLPIGDQTPKEVMTIIGDTMPGTIAPEVDLIAQKKTNGDKILKGRFNGIFEDFSANNIAIYDDSLGSATPPSGIKMAVVNKTTGDELYVAKNNTWELLDIGGGDDTIAFADLPTGTTSNTVAIGDHSHTLDNLSDVVITSPASGQVVSFNGTNWINQTPVTPPTNLNALTDVIITSPASGHTLSFDGSNWINATVAGGGGGDPVKFVTADIRSYALPPVPDAGKSIYVVLYSTSMGGRYTITKTVTYAYSSSWRVISASDVFVEGWGLNSISNSTTTNQVDEFFIASSHDGSDNISDVDHILTEFTLTNNPAIGYYQYYYGLAIYFHTGTVFKKLKPDIPGQKLFLAIDSLPSKQVYHSSPYEWGQADWCRIV